MIRIENNGSEITDTNYWNTKLNAAGKFFVSINGGAFRLLVPDKFLDEMRKELPLAEEIVITKRDGYMEILLDDRSSNPYVFKFTFNSFDRLPTRKDEGREFIFSAWTHGDSGPQKFYEHKCFYTS